MTEQAQAQSTRTGSRSKRTIRGSVHQRRYDTGVIGPTAAHAWVRQPKRGVIDDRHQLFGYDGLYVIDRAAMSANPGVKPSLTITALAERAMSFIPKANGIAT